MIEYPRLKEPYHPVVIDDQESAVLSEISQYIFHGRIFKFLIPLLDGKRSIHEISEHLADQYSAPIVYYHLLQMEKNGLLADGRRNGRQPTDIFLDQITDSAIDQKNPVSQVYYISTDNRLTDEIMPRLNNADAHHISLDDFYSHPFDANTLCIFLCPDYFENYLLEVNRRALSEKWAWLLFKPLGVMPWIGPLFEPNAKGCLECLLHRLRGHRILEYYHFKDNPATNARSLATGFTPFSLDIACGFLNLELEKIFRQGFDTSLNNSVLTLDLKSSEITRHKLIPRPQCPVCGKKQPFSHKTGSRPPPLRIRSRPKSGHQINTDRVIEAESTCRHLADHISPITGSIGTLRRITDIPEFFGYYYASTWPTLGRMAGWYHKARVSPTGISTGKGATDAQARASAMGEALERYATQVHGDELKIRATYADIQDEAIDPEVLITFSDKQYAERQMWRKKAETAYVPEPLEKSIEIDWTPAWSMTQNQWKRIPSAYVYYNYPSDRGGLFFNGDSNGVAAGNCLEEAILQAFFELIERDAAGIWWYNRIQPPGIDIDSFDISYANNLQKGLLSQGYDLFCLDLTTDLNIPAVAAVAIHAENPQEDPMIGLGAHFDIQIALVRALSELGQSWNLRSSFKVNEYYQKIDGRRLSDMAFMRPAPKTHFKGKESFTSLSTDDFLTDIEQCVQIIKQRDLEMLVIDLTRPDIGLHVVRVIVPGLAHFWPRFAINRLFQVPVKTGWRDIPCAEEALNPVPFYF